MDAPKMSRRQAKILWNNMTWQEKLKFNEMYIKLMNGDLALNHIGVDENENIMRIVLEAKEKPSLPTAPFAKHFHLPDAG